MKEDNMLKREPKQMNNEPYRKTNQAYRSTRFCFPRNVTNPWRLMAAGVAFCTAAVGVAYGEETFKFSVVYTFNGGTDGATPAQAPLSMDTAGNIHGTTTEGGNLTCFNGYGCGVVFTLTPSGSVSTLYAFPAVSFSLPGVVSGPKGELYGANGDGGIYGEVYALSPAGLEKTLYNFPSLTDGFFPAGGVIRDTAGNLYGTTYGGGNLTACGSEGCGVVFQLDPDGNETTLYTFQGAPGDGEAPASNLLRDKEGNLFGTTSGGGSFGSGTAFKLDRKGIETVLCSFNGAGPSTNSALIEDQEGNLYGVTGPQYDPGAVFKLDPKGNETVLYQFTGAADGRTPTGALIRDKAGNLYGTTQVGGNQDALCGGVTFGCGVVFKIDPNGNETVLYTFTGLADGANPASGLLPVRISSGTYELYGTAQFGGNLNCLQGPGYGCGTVFKFALPADTAFDPL
jgi:uncharacterized repeat protein (TIGR03803 family)